MFEEKMHSSLQQLHQFTNEIDQIGGSTRKIQAAMLKSSCRAEAVEGRVGE